MFDLDEDELKNFKKTFDLFDRDGNGDINKEEIIVAFNQLNIKLTDDEINNIFKQFDQNGNQSIEFEQFVTILKNNIDREQSESWLMEAFQIIDQDCDGRLSKQEMLRVVQLYELDVTEKDLNQILDAFDEGQNRGITYEAFSNLLNF